MIVLPHSPAIYGGGLHGQLSTDIAFIVHGPGTHDHWKFITSSHHRQFFRVKYRAVCLERCVDVLSSISEHATERLCQSAGKPIMLIVTLVASPLALFPYASYVASSSRSRIPCKIDMANCAPMLILCWAHGDVPASRYLRFFRFFSLPKSSDALRPERKGIKRHIPGLPRGKQKLFILVRCATNAMS
jgi:hypothetical protein